MNPKHAAGQGSLLKLYFGLRASFWFVPLLFVASAMIVSALSLRMDESEIGIALMQRMPLPLSSVEGARQILATIAGSTITIAGLVLSLTFVALTLMSQQFGPRILLVFMKDRPTQAVIGLFVGCFLYALFILGAVGTGQSRAFVPHLSLYFACGLSIASFLAMIYFIHHMAVSIQADTVVARLGHDLDAAIESALLAGDETEDDDESPDTTDHPQDVEQDAQPVSLDRSGYVQFIEYETALALMEACDGCVRYSCRPGHFMIEGMPAAYLESGPQDDDELLSKIAATIQLQDTRTQAQYAEYELNTLVEVALRALSPGINDPYTAIACVDHLTDALVRLLRGRMRAPVLRDSHGLERVIRYPQTFEHFLDSAFHPIRQAARGNTQMLLHLADGLGVLAAVANRDGRKKAICHHVEMLLEDCRSAIENRTDRDRVCDKLSSIRDQLA